MTAAFQMIEKAVKEVIEAAYPAAAGATGGDLNYNTGDALWVLVGLVGGSTTSVDGAWAVDIDVLAPTYGEAMGHALAIEAALVDRRHVATGMIIDRCVQNEAPSERPWDDESASRVGSAYVFTARRSG